MKPNLLDDLVRKARRVSPVESEAPLATAPPGFAAAVVRRWLFTTGEELSESWLVISRRGLAVALGLMVASMLWHARELRAPVLMESTASTTVALSLYPQ